MKPLVLPVAFCSLLALTLAFTPARGAYASQVSEVLATYAPAEPEARTVAAMTARAERFLAALDEEERARCALALDDPERRDWTNVPPRAEEKGLRLGDLTKEELRLVCDLLATALSPRGYARVRDILLADDRLLVEGRPRVGFGAENFWLLVFGTPSADAAWGLQLDGHHLALNLAFEGGAMSLSPSFLGAQPSAFDRDGEQVVPLGAAMSAAFALVGGLDDEQRQVALVATRRGQIVSGPGRDGRVPEPVGLECAELGEDARARLLALVGEHLAILPEAFAAERLAAFEAGLDATRFAWSGPTTEPGDVSYRVQGPNLLLEFACQDLGGDPLDHLHSMLRDPTNEYGAGFPRTR